MFCIQLFYFSCKSFSKVVLDVFGQTNTLSVKLYDRRYEDELIKIETRLEYDSFEPLVEA